MKCDVEKLIRAIVNAMVDAPNEVAVNRIEGSQITIYEIKVAKTDVGKIVGRHGRNATALPAADPQLKIVYRPAFSGWLIS